MGFNKDKNSFFVPIEVSPQKYFSRGKNTFLILFFLLFFALLPFFTYIVFLKTVGVLHLSDIEKNIDIVPPEQTLIQISNFYENYFPRSRLLKVKLDTLDRLSESTFEIQIQKIRIVKILLNSSWTPEPSLYKRLAKIFYEMNYNHESLRNMEIYMANSKETATNEIVESYILLYNITMKTGDYKKSIISAQNILKVIPNDLVWSFKLTQSYILNKQFTLARLKLEKLIYSSFKHILKHEVFFNLIDVLNKLKLYDKIDFYLKYMATMHSSQEEKDTLLSIYAKYLIEKREVEEAVDLWKSSYLIFNPKRKIKDAKYHFEQYLKS